MRKVLKIDGEGYFVEDVILTDNDGIPNDCISTACPEGFYKPKWLGGAWVEGKTQAEIDVIKNTLQPPTELEILQKQVSENQGAIDFIVMNF